LTKRLWNCGHHRVIAFFPRPEVGRWLLDTSGTVGVP